MIYLESLLVSHSKNLLGHGCFHGFPHAFHGKARQILGIEEWQSLLGVDGEPAGVGGAPIFGGLLLVVPAAKGRARHGFRIVAIDCGFCGLRDRMDLERVLLLLCVARFDFDSSNTGRTYRILSLYDSI